MAADDRALGNVQPVEEEVVEVQPRRRSDIGFDAKLAPTCMMWSIVVSLGFLILTVILWAVPNFGSIFR